MNVIAGMFKKFNNCRAMTEFTTKVKSNIFVGNILGKTVLGEPSIEIIRGWRLGGKTFTIESTTVMINDQAVACLTIEASESIQSFLVL